MLIVDEVLAVGDAEFQKKCLGKMKDVSEKDGRTVLFVSHNIKAIQQLCTSCILLRTGQVVSIGKTKSVVQQYNNQQSLSWENSSTEHVVITDVKVLDKHGNETALINYYEKLTVQVKVLFKKKLVKPAIDIVFYNNQLRLFALQSDKINAAVEVGEGAWTISFEIDGIGIIAEDIHFDLGIREMYENYLLIVTEVAHLSPNYGTVPTAITTNSIIHPKATCHWQTN